MFLATIEVAGYHLAAPGTTPEEAIRLLRKGTRKLLRTLGSASTWDAMDAHIQEIEIGHVYIEGGRCGEVRL